MLNWQVNKFSKDLNLVNPEDFDKEKFRELLSNFKNSAKKIDQDLLACLQSLGDNPESAIFYFEIGRNLRAGYIGLNRWCMTEGSAFQKGASAASEIWKFLFNEYPTKLADPPPPPGKRGEPVVDEKALAEWLKRISGK
jgi:hypothetical protein